MDFSIKEEIKTEVDYDESINSIGVDENNLPFVHCENEAHIKSEMDTEDPDANSYLNKTSGHLIMENKSRDKKNICVLCLMNVGKRNMPNHLRNYHKITQSVCFKRVGHEKGEATNKQSQTQYKIKCNHCWKEYQTNHEVRNCRNSHGEVNCEFCPIKKLDSYDLLEHKRITHNMEVEFQCKFPGCKESKKKKTLLMQHHRRVHKVVTQVDSSKNNGKRVDIKCDNCQQSFRSNGNLKRHMDRAKTNPKVCLETDSQVLVSHLIASSTPKCEEDMWISGMDFSEAGNQEEEWRESNDSESEDEWLQGAKTNPTICLKIEKDTDFSESEESDGDDKNSFLLTR